MIMTRSLNADQVRLLRLRAQQLTRRPSGAVTGPAQVVQVIGDLCGVQAQDTTAAALAVRARGAGLVASDVEWARVEERSVVRTWLMRGTLHLVAAQDLGWLLALLAPIFTRSSRGRRAELGLDEETGARGVRALVKMLGDQGPLTRAEIRQGLAPQGIPTAGQAAIHLIRLAALESFVCYGPERAGQETFALLADWIDPGAPVPPEQAPTELARRYLAAYGPATAEDFAAWSGLALGVARGAWAGLSGQLLEVKIGDGPAWMLQSRAAWLDEALADRPVVNLLPGFDTYWLGYRSRDLALDPIHARRVFPGGGMLRPALLVDGRAAGTWKIKRHRNHVEAIVEPFEELTPDIRRGLEREVEDLAHFLGSEARLKVMSK
jgi:hypothetical protein